tara:strand:- start:9220 stop:10119 length:900 start_codon:yes stop_codon:yes gene_type:complete
MNKIKTKILYKTKLDDRTIILVEGIDSINFLQNLISNNVESISKNNSIYSTLLNPQGKFLFDFIMFTKDNNKKLYLDCDRSRSEELIKQLNFYKMRKNLSLSIIENIEIIYLYGEYDALLSKLKLKNKEGYTSIINNIIFIVDPRNKKLGIRLYNFKNNLPNDIYAIQTKPIQEYEKLRINLTIPSGIKDLEIGKSFLLENNFESLNAIDFNKGCYIGQENTARQKYRATSKRMLSKIQITGKKLHIGEKIILNNRQVGLIKSSIGSLGLASIRKEVYEEYKLKNMEINVLKSKIKFIN